MGKAVKVLTLALVMAGFILPNTFADKKEGKDEGGWGKAGKQVEETASVSKDALKQAKEKASKDTKAVLEAYKNAKKAAMDKFKEANKAAKLLKGEEKTAAMKKAVEEKNAALKAAEEVKKSALEQIKSAKAKAETGSK